MDLPDSAIRIVAPTSPAAAYVFAHGAGAGMDHKFMAAFAEGLATRGIATLRFDFPFMQQGGKRPDPPAIAHAAVRAAIARARQAFGTTPLFAGGKSFGGRMTSQAQAASPLEQVRGLVFVGFPLHPAGKPGTDRADHLANATLPMLFLQGTRDELADWKLIEATTAKLPNATLHRVEHADHAFHVLKASGRRDAEVLGEILDAAAAWMKARA